MRSQPKRGYSYDNKYPWQHCEAVHLETNMAAEKAIEEQCKKQGIKRALDVEELYLAESNIDNVPDMGRFKNLKRLWLNENKLYILQGLNTNYHLTELYLQSNLLTNINGALQRLRCLQVLLLHGNQLISLTDVIYELRNAHSLTTLNLFGNPLAQDYDYRMYVVFSLKSLETLDRKEITEDERIQSFKKYEVERQRIKDSIAFGRRAEDQMAVDETSTSRPISCFVSNHSLYLGKQLKNDGDEARETVWDDAASIPGDKITSAERPQNGKTISQFKRFGWIDVLEARTKSKDAKVEPCVYTTRFNHC